MAIHIRRREFTSTLAAWLHGHSRYAGTSRRCGVYRRGRTTNMSDKKVKRTSAGVPFDMRRTGIFALCAVLVPQVAASYGVRLSAIPEAYWGTWVPAAEICQDATFGQGICHLGGELRRRLCGRNIKPEGPYLLCAVAMHQHGRAGAKKSSQSHHPAGRYQPDFHGPSVRQPQALSTLFGERRDARAVKLPLVSGANAR
jgi:hypothetical protein